MLVMDVRFPLSLRNVEDPLFKRGIDVCHETVRMWWSRFGPMFAADVRSQRSTARRSCVIALKVSYDAWNSVTAFIAWACLERASRASSRNAWTVS